METTSKRMHPLIAGAAVSVIVVSLVGVAAITGLLPKSHSTAAPGTAPVVAAAAAPAPLPVPEPATVATQAASRAASAAVDSKYAMAQDDEPIKQPKQLARPKPVTQARANTPVYDAPPPPPSYGSPSYPPVAAPAPVYAPAPQQVAQAPLCQDCGRVEAVRVIATQQAPSGLGVVGGAVLGGILGNQVGGGSGRTLATVAGAVGGGYAGNEVEKRTRGGGTSYEVRVRMEDGNVRSFPYNNQPNWSVGDRVRVVDGYLRRAA